MIEPQFPDLPAPSLDALAQSAALSSRIVAQIGRAGGWIPFSLFMEHVLYTPGLGYYSGGSAKIGEMGDFVTAPEITPIFGRTLARQVAQILSQTSPEILEVGAGTGALAAQVMAELDGIGMLPLRYGILEVSAELRVRQRQTLVRAVPHLMDRIIWFDQMPERIDGVVVGNEVLDAMPAAIMVKGSSGWQERGVGLSEEKGFSFVDRAASPSMAAAVTAHVPAANELATGYACELNLAACAFATTLAQRIGRGAALLIDYGFPAREMYHPQRREGTLMAHYRHRAHTDPFLWPGLQDLTVHVDFSAIARAARRGGATVLGYTSQASFLINLGLTDVLSTIPTGTRDWLVATNAVQRLVSEAEMGELFKVMAFGRDLGDELDGFHRGDRSASL